MSIAPPTSSSNSHDSSLPRSPPAHAPPAPFTATSSPASPPSKRIPVIIDCDPGHDDFFAIVLAAYHPSLQLLGLTTTGGNSTLELTTANALKTLHISGLDDDHIPVVPGCPHPLLRPAIPATLSGLTGLDGPHFPPVATPPHPGHAIDWIYSTAHAWLDGQGRLPPLPSLLSPIPPPPSPSPTHSHPDGVILLCIGPLTNVALLLLRYPHVRLLLRSIVLMGGALHHGNATPHAEFNVWTDPEAARVVMQCGVELVMVPLEVTHTALAVREVVERVRQGVGGVGGGGSVYRGLLVELLTFYEGEYRKEGMQAAPLHDPCAVAYVIDEAMFEWHCLRVEVDCGEEQAGRTVVVKESEGKPNNVRVCTRMNVAKFWEMQLAAIDAADARSPVNRSR